MSHDCVRFLVQKFSYNSERGFPGNSIWNEHYVTNRYLDKVALSYVTIFGED